MHPCTQVCLWGLVDDVDHDFLQTICDSFGELKEVELKKLPGSSKSAGVATVKFSTASDAMSLADAYDQESLLGGQIRAMIDPGGRLAEWQYRRAISQDEKREESAAQSAAPPLSPEAESADPASSAADPSGPASSKRARRRKSSTASVEEPDELDLRLQGLFSQLPQQQEHVPEVMSDTEADDHLTASPQAEHKPEAKPGPAEAKAPATSKLPAVTKKQIEDAPPTSWICVKCGNLNLFFRTECQTGTCRRLRGRTPAINGTPAPAQGWLGPGQNPVPPPNPNPAAVPANPRPAAIGPPPAHPPPQHLVRPSMAPPADGPPNMMKPPTHAPPPSMAPPTHPPPRPSQLLQRPLPPAMAPPRHPPPPAPAGVAAPASLMPIPPPLRSTRQPNQSFKAQHAPAARNALLAPVSGGLPHNATRPGVMQRPAAGHHQHVAAAPTADGRHHQETTAKPAPSAQMAFGAQREAAAAAHGGPGASGKPASAARPNDHDALSQATAAQSSRKRVSRWTEASRDFVAQRAKPAAPAAQAQAAPDERRPPNDRGPTGGVQKEPPKPPQVAPKPKAAETNWDLVKAQATAQIKTQLRENMTKHLARSLVNKLTHELVQKWQKENAAATQREAAPAPAKKAAPNKRPDIRALASIKIKKDRAYEAPPLKRPKPKARPSRPSSRAVNDKGRGKAPDSKRARTVAVASADAGSDAKLAPAVARKRARSSDGSESESDTESESESESGSESDSQPPSKRAAIVDTPPASDGITSSDKRAASQVSSDEDRDEPAPTASAVAEDERATPAGPHGASDPGSPSATKGTSARPGTLPPVNKDRPGKPTGKAASSRPGTVIKDKPAKPRAPITSLPSSDEDDSDSDASPPAVKAAPEQAKPDEGSSNDDEDAESDDTSAAEADEELVTADAVKTGGNATVELLDAVDTADADHAVVVEARGRQAVPDAQSGPGGADEPDKAAESADNADSAMLNVDAANTRTPAGATATLDMDGASDVESTSADDTGTVTDSERKNIDHQAWRAPPVPEITREMINAAEEAVHGADSEDLKYLLKAYADKIGGYSLDQKHMHDLVWFPSFAKGLFKSLESAKAANLSPAGSSMAPGTAATLPAPADPAPTAQPAPAQSTGSARSEGYHRFKKQGFSFAEEKDQTPQKDSPTKTRCLPQPLFFGGWWVGGWGGRKAMLGGVHWDALPATRNTARWKY